MVEVVDVAAKKNVLRPDGDVICNIALCLGITPTRQKVRELQISG